MQTRSFLLHPACLLLPLFLNTGCAMTAANNCTGGATCTQNATSTVTVSPELKLALGDKVAEAAANLATLGLKGIAGPITDAAKQAAVEKGVTTLLAGAKDPSKVTPEVKEEATKLMVSSVDEAAKTQPNGGATPATP